MKLITLTLMAELLPTWKACLMTKAFELEVRSATTPQHLLPLPSKGQRPKRKEFRKGRVQTPPPRKERGGGVMGVDK
jgi:hypothetical protein